MSDPLSYLFGLEQFGIKFGLDNIRALVASLGHPERAYRVVHVAGTNGKGSVTAMVDACLRAGGRRSARYTSPHLVDVTERFVVDGAAIDRAALAGVVADLRDRIEALTQSGVLAATPTFFEVATAAAFELFRRAAVEIAVIEVGLGGRLDATNVVAPVATAITSIGVDHEQYLGPTLEAIAREKAGIVKPGVPVVVGALPPAADETIAAIARERGARLVRAPEGAAATRVDERHVRLRTPRADYGTVRFALAGEHQTANLLVAVRTLELLGDAAGAAPSAGALDAGLAAVEWPGRLDRRRLPDGREALLDAAHNPQGAAALAAYLAASAPRPLVFAAMRDKDVRGILTALAPAVSAIVFTAASNPRTADPAELARVARAAAPHLPTLVAPAPADALRTAWRLAPRIVVAGSIFLLGDVLPIIERERP